MQNGCIAAFHSADADVVHPAEDPEGGQGRVIFREDQ